MLKMVLASGNKNKYREMRSVLQETGIDLLFGGDFNMPVEVEETGDTYEENSYIKAKAWMDFTGCAAIADDSGIEVDALGCVPGVHSARIVPGSDADRTNWLLAQMAGKEDRTARFVACLVAVFPEIDKPIVCQKNCEGKLAFTPAGSSGFGYDPIFIPNGYDKTFSELGDEIKQKISHRALALKGIAEMLLPVVQSIAVRKDENVLCASDDCRRADSESKHWEE
ncbi:RdgB/HAM1 family non-canonical purine NTP pyrophosphatase [Synergistaceae bacterium OttesenSCG-928-D05]|nr:RdgB/HAM1 family non-canonical purine NTP pyrophosphatase [Synergistaceae bacterium OttesenSCG-928-D05]